MSLKTPPETKNPHFKQSPFSYDLSFDAYKSYANLIQPSEKNELINSNPTPAGETDFFDWSLVNSEKEI